MELNDPTASALYEAVVRSGGDLVVGLDFDGTLAPIVEDPTQAHVHPDVPDLLVALADRVRGVAVVTGRPVRQALALGDLDQVGTRIAERHRSFIVLGQYGNERWTAVDRRVVSPRPPAGLAGFLREVPSLVRRADAADAYVEPKGLAVALHTRRLPDPVGSFARLLPLVADAATRHGLAVEPGRLVVEVRAPGMHKGLAVSRLAEEWSAKGFLFAGDDLGDVEAFTELRAMRDDGIATMAVCSHGGDGPEELEEIADHVVDGPEGVVDFLKGLVADLGPQAG
ncbi:trehalose-phosphatase [Nocardioides daphniae]|uniref:Trehalose 6-phosphate phosphatase n=1 Tax=Nocardioides daphniae TaxID=402297 RepID=A0A4P7UCW6_9ACTN|nr:trehalose-phosphatase [Nocardioides daphniae]QCC78053.1 trehalose-phosphatase [Nocardioides daphniae]GGD22653.1 trehalose 6-phosphate phosphatase [Nocardioides daphniae]